MNIKLKFLAFFFITLPVFLSMNQLGHAFDRMIINQSDAPWVISANHDIIFDNPNDHRLNGPRKVCKRQSDFFHHCVLNPGEMTYVYYPHDCIGRLTFATELSNHQNRVINVDYECYTPHYPHVGPDSLQMKSKDETRINDNHGDIAIFPNATH